MPPQLAMVMAVVRRAIRWSLLEVELQPWLTAPRAISLEQALQHTLSGSSSSEASNLCSKSWIKTLSQLSFMSSHRLILTCFQCLKKSCLSVRQNEWLRLSATISWKKLSAWSSYLSRLSYTMLLKDPLSFTARPGSNFATKSLLTAIVALFAL